MGQSKTHVFERDDKLYIVGAVTPFDPSDHEIEELAFAADVKKMSPNSNLWWLRGQYVEADRPNENGALWSGDELAIKSLTPMLMPVTVMHDPRTAVGLIADTALVTRDSGAPRSRIDSTLALWKHRFPDVCEEAAENYRQGTLMQSMECLPAYYDCGECGARFPKLPGGVEKVNWCEHLQAGETAAANGAPVRRLGNVTFTGTGLIFGTRGARGAFDKAHLELLEEEVAEFHERVQRPDKTRRRTSNMDTIEIAKTEYAELQRKASRTDDLEAKVSGLEEQAAKVPELESKVESEETARKAAEGERDTLKTEKEGLEEQARTASLSKDRLGKLGKGFTEKLGDFTRGRLEEQAGALKDEEWEDRLKELEETAGVTRDDGEAAGGDGGAGSGSDGTFSAEETARSQVGSGGGAAGNGGNGSEPSAASRRSVVAGLVRKP